MQMADYAFEYLKSNKIRKMKIRLDIKYEYILLVYIIENAFSHIKRMFGKYASVTRFQSMKGNSILLDDNEDIFAIYLEKWCANIDKNNLWR
jgi:hypothetical protein